ncbi:hypothetical protein ACWDV4_24755 [Micromonospora sp. NPDC003197]
MIFQPPTEQAMPPSAEPAMPPSAAELDPATPNESEGPPQTTPRKRTNKAATGRTTGKTTQAAGATAEPTDATPPKRTARKATPTKQTKPKKAASTKATIPTAEPHTVETRTPEPRTDEQPVAPTPVTARILAHPGYAPELLATAAVEVLGPTAASWVRRTRSTYPAASPEGLARLATQRFVRSASIGGVISITTTGLLAPLAELATVSWAQAALALHLAAAYGHDPAHPDRAVDLLVLTQVHPDDESARGALAASRQAGPEGELPAYRIMEAAWRLAAPLAAQTGGWVALRLAARILPGAAALAVAAGDAATTQRFAARAVARYRPPRRA